MKTPKELAARFPYQFAGKNLGLCVSKGWFPLFVQLCTEIDKLLGDNKRNFRWRQVKEKFGTGRFYWSAEKPSGVAAVELIHAIGELVRAAEQQTAATCAVYGEPGALDRSECHLLTLCHVHSAARKEDAKSLGLWFESADEFPSTLQYLNSLKSLIEDGQS